MILRYIGQQQYAEYLEATAGELTVSPGGAALILGVSRQRVRALYEEKDDIRAWLWWEKWGAQASCVDVSVLDLFRWAIRSRGVRSLDQLHMGSPRLEQEFERALELAGLTTRNPAGIVS